MPKYLDPKSDVVFKKIFGERPHLLKSFLNAILPLPEDGLIDTLEYLTPEQVPTIPALKKTVVDVKCKDHQGKIFIVEMQIQWTDSFMDRMLFNASNAYVRQLGKGEDYKLLNPVYGLGILVHTFDCHSDDWYHHYKIVNVKKPEREIKGLQLVFLEIPKFKPHTISQKKLQVLWLRFLSEINEKNKNVEPEFFSVPEIKEALYLSEEAGFSEAELEAYDKYWDMVSCEKTLWNARFEEGKVEGEEVGIKKGEEIGIKKGEEIGLQKGYEKAQLEIALRMLELNIPKGFQVATRRWRR